jgi:DNA-binding CsgD family transcriptional regulator
MGKSKPSTDGSTLAVSLRQVRMAARKLSPREREVLAQVLTGKSCKEIAETLGLSDHTIVDYLKRLHKHFGVNTRAELMACFISEKERKAVEGA